MAYLAVFLVALFLSLVPHSRTLDHTLRGMTRYPLRTTKEMSLHDLSVMRALKTSATEEKTDAEEPSHSRVQQQPASPTVPESLVTPVLTPSSSIPQEHPLQMMNPLLPWSEEHSVVAGPQAKVFPKDEMTLFLGRHGRFQLRIVRIGILAAFVLPFHGLLLGLVNPDVDHWCARPEDMRSVL